MAQPSSPSQSDFGTVEREMCLGVSVETPFESWWKPKLEASKVSQTWQLVIEMNSESQARYQTVCSTGQMTCRLGTAAWKGRKGPCELIGRLTGYDLKPYVPSRISKKRTFGKLLT